MLVEQKTRIQEFFEKKEVGWVLILAVFFGTVFIIFVSNDFFYSDFNSYFTLQPTRSRENIALPVRVVMDFGNGKKRAFEAATALPLGAAEALRGAQEAGNFSLNIALSGEITEIDKVRSGRAKRWQWYINGVRQERPILDGVIRGGDTLLVKYE